ncbi:MAG TPA: hypothetical protein VL500_01775 [Candidatus Eisenbacteria bacterium]|nr:hypothetical protein [Candidatus Eisenbacteria bacterium]
MSRPSKVPFAAGLMLVGLVAAGFGCGPKASLNANGSLNLNAGAAAPEPRQLEVALSAQGGSGVSGKALLIEQGTQTKVMLNLNGTTMGVKNPAHIHLGSCPTPGEVKYALTSLTEGKSVTVLDVSFDAVVSGLPLAVNVHKSDADIANYVACGDLLSADVKAKVPGAEAMMSSSTTTKPALNVNAGAEAAAEAKTTVTLKTAGALGASGTATIEADGDKTVVTVSLTGGPSEPHPAFIRKGLCSAAGDVKYKLSDVVGGSSKTAIDAKLEDVMAGGQLSIDVRQSATLLTNVLACGDLPLWDPLKMMFKI